MSGEKLLNTQETLERLKVSRKTLYALMERGKIQPVNKPSYLKRAPKLQFRESDIEKLLAGETAEEESPPGNRVAVAS